MVDSIIKLLSTFLVVVIQEKNLYFQHIYAEVFRDEEFSYLQFSTGTSKNINRSSKYSKPLTTVELRRKVYKCSLYYFNFSVYLKFFSISWGKSIELYKNTYSKPAKSVSYMCISISIGARGTFRDYGMAFRGISSLKLNLHLHSSPGDYSRAISCFCQACVFVTIVEKPILVLSSLHPSNKISPACTTCFLNLFNTLSHIK